MAHVRDKVRVLYSFPGKLGGGRIGFTSWQQVTGLAAAGAEVIVLTGVLHTTLPANVTVRPTLSYGRARISYKLVGSLRAFAIHDWIVARRLEELRDQIDIVHTWPLAALRTLSTAARLGIPTVYERPNAHTRFFYEAVQNECAHLGLRLAPNHEHNWNEEVLRIEEQEYQLATRILCPSRHVVETFRARGFAPERLARHRYGYDPGEFYPSASRSTDGPLTMLFVGGLSPVKGLHYALPAWLQSSACRTGRFLLAGDPTPEYMTMLAPFLNHPSIRLLGHRGDVPELMRNSDVLVLPSISEGCPLVCAEAIGSGCVPLVSDRIDACEHMRNGLVHPVGNVDALAKHISMVDENRDLLRRLRTECLKTASQVTWRAAGVRLLEVYNDIVDVTRQQLLPQSRAILSQV
jgi:glycosyltransferase involved in cell wall biosynthesis